MVANGGENVKSKIVFIIGSILILGSYGAFRVMESLKQDDLGNAPVINIDSTHLTISVNDQESVLLEGVNASDVEDGDVSGNLFIESLSPFDENGHRTATFAVFDSDNQVSWATRTFDYTDYTPPRFTLNAPLITVLSDIRDDSPLKKIGAVSSVDGNITSKISAKQNLGDNGTKISLSVTDSTGTTANLDLNIESNLNALSANLEIVLSDYLIYVPIGQTVDPYHYIKDILLNKASRIELTDEIIIDSNYDPNTPGIYEIRYTLNRSNGDYGLTKLIVIVEE